MDKKKLEDELAKRSVRKVHNRLEFGSLYVPPAGHKYASRWDVALQPEKPDIASAVERGEKEVNYSCYGVDLKQPFFLSHQYYWIYNQYELLPFLFISGWPMSCHTIHFIRK